MEEVYASIVGAMTAANVLKREFSESYFVTDDELPRWANGTLDDRIVWRQDEPSDAARRWVIEQNRIALATEIARRWADRKAAP